MCEDLFQAKDLPTNTALERISDALAAAAVLPHAAAPVCAPRPEA